MKAIFTRSNAARTRIIADDGDGCRIAHVRDSNRQLEEQHEDAVRALCAKMGWTGKLVGGYTLVNGATVGRVWVWDDSRALRLTIKGKKASPMQRTADELDALIGGR